MKDETSDSDRKGAEDISLEYAKKRFPHDSFKMFVAASAHKDGRSSALKELEQVAREAFEAAREEVRFKEIIYGESYDFHTLKYDDFSDYWQQRNKGDK